MLQQVMTAPGVIEIIEAPVPEIGDGQALIRIEKVGICGSDVHGYHGHDPRRVPPLILGHEAAGRVVAGVHEGRRRLRRAQADAAGGELHRLLHLQRARPAPHAAAAA